MTIPYLPGWFDQNKEAIQSLIGTVAKRIDPTIENRMMLEKLMQNPQNVQQLVDIASLNPQMIQNLYGAQNLARIQGMGAPSAATQIESAGRDILRTGIVPETPVGEAAASALKFKTPAEREAERLSNLATKQQIEYYGFQLGQAQLEAAAKNPGLQAQMRTIDAALAANPDAAQYDPRGLADEYFSGRGTPQQRQQLVSKIQAMTTASPVAGELFSQSLQAIQQAKMQDRQDARLLQSERNAASREDLTLSRQLRLAAIDIAEKYGARIEDALKYVKGEPGAEIVQNMISRDRDLSERSQRLRQLSGLTAQLTQLSKAKADDKATILTGINTALQEFAPGVSLVSTAGDWFSKGTKYRYNGQDITGEQFSMILSNPQAAAAQMEQKAKVDAMDLATAQKALTDLDAAKNQISADMYNTTKALLQARVRELGRTRR